jgi:hypothetical protein
MTEKGVATGGASSGVSRRRGATGVAGSGTRGTRARVIKTGRTEVGEGPLRFPCHRNNNKDSLQH